MEEQTQILQTLVSDIQGGWARVKELPDTFKSLQDNTSRLEQNVNDVRRLLLARGPGSPRLRRWGVVSDECARSLAASFILHCERSSKLDALCSVPSQRDALLDL